LGANEVIPEEFETSVEIFARVLAKYLIPRDEIDKLVIELRSDGYEMFRNLSRKSSMFSSLDLHLPDVEVSSMRIEEDSPIEGKSLVELELRKKYGVTVLAVRRDSQTFPNPDVESPFLTDDVLYVVGAPEKLAESARLFCKSGGG
jgi:CPA2 family monovalent cation:H+ antiporter-2